MAWSLSLDRARLLVSLSKTALAGVAARTSRNMAALMPDTIFTWPPRAVHVLTEA
jgi:hypothetical protein